MLSSVETWEWAACWVLFGSILGAAVADKRGQAAVVGYLLGAVLGPVLVWLLLANPKATRRCPGCDEPIEAGTLVCGSCGKDVPVGSASQDQALRAGLIGVSCLLALTVVFIHLYRASDESDKQMNVLEKVIRARNEHSQELP